MGAATRFPAGVCPIGPWRTKEIAQSLFVSLRTIETHLTNAYRKLGITARAQLTRALAERAEVPESAV